MSTGAKRDLVLGVFKAPQEWQSVDRRQSLRTARKSSSTAQFVDLLRTSSHDGTGGPRSWHASISVYTSPHPERPPVNDPNAHQNRLLHDELLAGRKDYDTEAEANQKMNALDESRRAAAANNTGGAGFEWILALFLLRGGRHFLAGVTLTVVAAWALFHVWIVAPSPTGFAVPTKALGANWNSNFRGGMENAGIKGAALQQLMANCTATSCTVPAWPAWKQAAAAAAAALPVDLAYCQAWDRVRTSSDSQADNKRSAPPRAGILWRVTDVNYTGGGKEYGCVLSRPLSYADHFWFSLAKSLVVVLLLIAGIIATIVHVRRLPPSQAPA